MSKDKKYYSYTVVNPQFNEETRDYDLVQNTFIFDSAEELFESADNVDHEALIKNVRENNFDAFSTKNSIVGKAFIAGVVGLVLVNTLNNLKNGMGNHDTYIDDYIFLLIKSAFIAIEASFIYKAIKDIINKIIHLISTKEIRECGNEYVEKKYPDEYKTIGDPKRYRKLRHGNRQNIEKEA